MGVLLEVNWKVINFKAEKTHQDKILFIKYIIEKGVVEVTYFPSKEMWSDALTKLKQGEVFREYSLALMNWLVDYEDSKDWEDIYMIAGVSNPGSALFSTT